MLILSRLSQYKQHILESMIPGFVEIKRCSGETAEQLERYSPDALITELSCFSSFDLKSIESKFDCSRILILGDESDQGVLIAAMAAGGIVYTPPGKNLRRILKTFLLSCCRNSDPPSCRDNLGIIGESSGIRDLRKDILSYAPLSDTVIITGETGTGKELAAWALHCCSGRPGNLMPLNCAALPETLIESEFFGVSRGAYTGADSNKQGYLAAAENGTLFLDEIGDMPLCMQTKLLRVLEDKMVTPLGSTRSRSVNVRLILATSRSIKDMMAEGLFRKDLYYRLNVLSLSLPALRKRRRDIPLLVRHFLNLDGSPKSLTPKAMIKLMDHNWPGNVRELKGIIRRAEIFSGNEDSITPHHIRFI